MGTPVSDGHGRHHVFPGFVIAADGGSLAMYRDFDDHYVRASASRGPIAGSSTCAAPAMLAAPGERLS